MSRNLSPQRIAESDHGKLGRAIRGHQGRGEETGGRGDVDHMPGAAADHVWQEELEAVHDAHDVDVEEPSPVFQIDGN